MIKNMKVCSACHQPKPISKFYIQTISSDGHAAICRKCARAETGRRGEAIGKRCPRCGRAEPEVTFGRNRRRGDGRAVYCASCTRLYANTYYAAKSHDCIVSKAYGLKRGQYAEMLEAQGGVCAICGQPEAQKFAGKLKRLSVDHDHQTGRARALLCSACNAIIGYGQDDKARLQKAIAYLEAHGL